MTKQGQELIQENIPTAQASRFQTFMRKLANVVINAELVIALVVMVAVLLPPVIGYMVTFVMDNKIKLIIGLVIFNVVLLYASRSKKVRIGATVNQN